MDPEGALSPDVVQARSVLAAARRIAVLSGAGISAESGVPTFRDAGGLWEGRSPESLATPGAFAREPAEVWRFYRRRIEALAGVAPNAGHRALAELERRCERFWLLTQNVDGLHATAGSRNVVELHGTLSTLRCVHCGRRSSARETLAGLPDDRLPTCGACGGLLRPDVVWYGELLPDHALAVAAEAISRCQVMLVVGTSGVVQPAASFAASARAAGARIVEVNPERTPISPLARPSLRGTAATLLPLLVGSGAPAAEP